MILAICKITLRLPGNQSLKGKRGIIRSLISRTHNKFNVSVAEIEDNDSWHIASIGLACVSNSTVHAEKTIIQILDFIDNDHTGGYIVNQEQEFIDT